MISPIQLPPTLRTSQCLTSIAEFVRDADVSPDSMPDHIKTSVAKRQHEFLAGRHCAAVALTELGGPPEVGRSSDRSPIWPTNFCGSISHSDDLAWAVVANRQNLQSIGIDAERFASNKTVEKTHQRILNSEELACLTDAGLDRIVAFTLAFSAKESVYKCLYPLGVRVLEFLHLSIVALNNNTVTIHHNASDRLPPLQVNFAVTNDHAFTLCYQANRTTSKI